MFICEICDEKIQGKPCPDHDIDACPECAKVLAGHKKYALSLLWEFQEYGDWSFTDEQSDRFLALIEESLLNDEKLGENDFERLCDLMGLLPPGVGIGSGIPEEFNNAAYDAVYSDQVAMARMKS